MKTIVKTTIAMLVVLFSLTFTSCSNDDNQSGLVVEHGSFQNGQTDMFGYIRIEQIGYNVYKVTSPFPIERILSVTYDNHVNSNIPPRMIQFEYEFNNARSLTLTLDPVEYGSGISLYPNTTIAIEGLVYR